MVTFQKAVQWKQLIIRFFRRDRVTMRMRTPQHERNLKVCAANALNRSIAHYIILLVSVFRPGFSPPVWIFENLSPSKARRWTFGSSGGFQRYFSEQCAVTQSASWRILQFHSFGRVTFKMWRLYFLPLLCTATWRPAFQFFALLQLVTINS